MSFEYFNYSLLVNNAHNIIGGQEHLLAAHRLGWTILNVLILPLNLAPSLKPAYPGSTFWRFSKTQPSSRGSFLQILQKPPQTPTLSTACAGSAR